MKSLVKNLYISILTIIVVMVACDKKDTDLYEVSGRLANVSGNYFLISYEIKDSLVMDTIPIDTNGEFSFKGEIDTLTIMSFFFNDNTKNTFALVGKGQNIKIEGDVENPDLINVRGGQVNDDLTEFKNKNKDLLLSREQILRSADENLNSKDSSKVEKHIADLKLVNFNLFSVADTYIKQYPEKIVSVLLLNAFFKDETTISKLDENLKILRGRAVEFPMADELKKFRDRIEISSVNHKAPAITYKNLKGKEVSLTDAKGKYILLSFVSTTCEICRNEMLEAKDVYSKLKKQKKEIEFITIVKDIEDTPVSKNIADSLKWDVLPVEGGWGAKAFVDYYIREIPYNILIDPYGTILQRDIPVSAVSDKLDQLLVKDKK